jgi:DNA-binding transcriptional regulator GbsR (MarR family)
MAGTSQHIKRRMAELAKVLEITDHEAKAKYTVAALGETMLRCFDAWQRAGEMTVSEFAEETGKKIGSIRTALQYAVRLELATYEQEHQKAPKVYTFAPDFWQRVDELRPNLRTHTLPEQRENARLKGAQRWAHRGAELETDDEKRKKLNARLMHAANKRMKLLEVCYADKNLSQADIARIAFDAQAPSGLAFTRVEDRAEVRSALRTMGFSAALAQHPNLTGNVRSMIDQGLQIAEQAEEIELGNFAWQQIHSGVINAKEANGAAPDHNRNADIRNMWADGQAKDRAYSKWGYA